MENSKVNLKILEFKELFKEIMEREPTPKERLTYMEYVYRDGLEKVKNILMSTNEYNNKRLISWSRNCTKVKLDELSTEKSNLSVKFYITLGVDGKSHVSKEYILALLYLGVNVKIEVVDIKSNIILERETMASCLENNIEYNKVFINTSPEHWKQIAEKERSLNPKIMIYAFVSWFASKIPEEWKEYLLDVDRLIVPSKFAQDIFSEYFDKPIHHVPYIIEINYSKKECILPYNKKDYIFYCIADNTPRKNLYNLINDYLEEFTEDEDVFLLIKTNSNNPEIIKEITSKFNKKIPRMLITDMELMDEEILFIHDISHCYISVAHGENVSLSLCTAAMLQKNIICIKYGGHVEYLRNVTFLEPVMTKADVSYMNLTLDATWASYKSEDLKEAMRYAFDNRLKGSNNTRKLIKENYNYKNVGKKLLDVIEN